MQYDPPEINSIFQKYSSIFSSYSTANTLNKQKPTSVSDIRLQYILFLESFAFDFLKVLSTKQYKHCLIKEKQVEGINCEKFKAIDPEQNEINSFNQKRKSLHQVESINPLQVQIEEAYKEIHKLKQSNDAQYEAIKTLRSTYQRELNHLRDSINCIKTNDKFQYVDIRVFDGFTGLSEDVMLVFNSKMEFVQQSYLDRIEKLMKSNTNLKNELQMQASESKENTIPLSEQNAEGFISRLSKMNEEPKHISEALIKYYGNIWGESAGVSENNHVVISTQHDNEEPNNKADIVAKTLELRKEYDQIIEGLKKQADEEKKQAQSELDAVKADRDLELVLHNKEIESIRKEIEETVDTKIKIKENLFKDKLEEEKNKVKQTMIDYQETIETLKLRFTLRRWSMLNYMLKVNTTQDAREKQRITQLCIALSSGKIEQLANQYSKAYANHVSQISMQKTELQKMYDEMLFQQKRCIKQNSSTVYDERILTLTNSQQEYIIKIDEKEANISQLKATINDLGSQLKTLAEHINRSNEESIEKMKQSSTVVKASINMKQTDDETLTDICDVKIPIQPIKALSKPVMISKEVQFATPIILQKHKSKQITHLKTMSFKSKPISVCIAANVDIYNEMLPLQVFQEQAKEKEVASSPFITQYTSQIEKLSDEQISIINKYIKSPNPSRSIIRPVYKIVPFNIHSLENLLYKRSHRYMADVEIQTDGIESVYVDCYNQIVEASEKRSTKKFIQNGDYEDERSEKEKENSGGFHMAFKVMKKTSKYLSKTKKEIECTKLPEQREKPETAKKPVSDFNIRYNGVHKLKFLKKNSDAYSSNTSTSKYMVVGKRPSTSSDTNSAHRHSFRANMFLNSVKNFN